VCEFSLTRPGRDLYLPEVHDALYDLSPSHDANFVSFAPGIRRGNSISHLVHSGKPRELAGAVLAGDGCSVAFFVRPRVRSVRRKWR
jgi:hypothetical protein